MDMLPSFLFNRIRQNVVENPSDTSMIYVTRALRSVIQSIRSFFVTAREGFALLNELGSTEPRSRKPATCICIICKERLETSQSDM